MHFQRAAEVVNTTIQPSNVPPDQSFPPGFLKESRAPAIIAGNATCQLFGTLVMIARVYSRAVVHGVWKAEDYMLIVAWIGATCCTSLQLAQATSGAGRHFVALSQPEIVQMQRYAFAALVSLTASLPLSKIGLSLTYLRIFHGDDVRRRLIKGLIAILFLLILGPTIEVIFQCTPIAAYWNDGRPKDKCLPDISAYFVTGTVNVLCDIILIAIVLPRMVNLRVPRRAKCILAAIVLLGGLAVGAGVIRMVRVGQAIDGGTGYDLSWHMYDTSIWQATELHVGLMCASAPGLKPLASKMLPCLIGTSSKSTVNKASSGHNGSNAIEKRTEIEMTDALRLSSTTMI